MTIGIAASGPRAGQAVFEALRAAERVASGAIGGFASFVAITERGEVFRAETQRGGTATLFVDGETTGTEPPPHVAAARLAGVMSSGPDRPAPLAQFVPAEGGVGLVTGHRLPNTPGAAGVALNLEALRLMTEGRSPRDAVDAVLDANPEADAGMIAADRAGRIHARNSARVARRPDLGHARRDSAGRGAVVEVLHNSIVPIGPIAALAADTALETMAPMLRADAWVLVNAGTRLALGDVNALVVDDAMVVQEVITTDRRLLDGRQNGAAIYLHSFVRQGERLLGRTTAEPYVVVEGGRIVSMSGQTSLRLGIQFVGTDS